MSIQKLRRKGRINATYEPIGVQEDFGWHKQNICQTYDIAMHSYHFQASAMCWFATSSKCVCFPVCVTAIGTPLRSVFLLSCNECPKARRTHEQYMSFPLNCISLTHPNHIFIVRWMFSTYSFMLLPTHGNSFKQT